MLLLHGTDIEFASHLLLVVYQVNGLPHHFKSLHGGYHVLLTVTQIARVKRIMQLDGFLRDSRMLPDGLGGSELPQRELSDHVVWVHELRMGIVSTRQLAVRAYEGVVSPHQHVLVMHRNRRLHQESKGTSQLSLTVPSLRVIRRTPFDVLNRGQGTR